MAASLPFLLVVVFVVTVVAAVSDGVTAVVAAVVIVISAHDLDTVSFDELSQFCCWSMAME